MKNQSFMPEKSEKKLGQITVSYKILSFKSFPILVEQPRTLGIYNLNRKSHNFPIIFFSHHYFPSITSSLSNQSM